MMKKFLIASIALLPVISFGQKTPPAPMPDMPIDSITKLVSYSAVIAKPNTSQRELYFRADAWIKSYFKNPTGVIQSMDTTKWTIELKHGFDTHKTTETGATLIQATFKYSITLNFKEGKFRYTITNFSKKDVTQFPVEKMLDDNDPHRDWNVEVLQQLDDHIMELLQSLKARMDLPATSVKKDEW